MPEKHGSSACATWVYLGTEGTTVTLTSEGEVKIKNEFDKQLSCGTPSARYERDRYKAPEQVMHANNLYLILLFELRMYGRIHIPSLVRKFERTYGQTGMYFDPALIRIFMCLDVTFEH